MSGSLENIFCWEQPVRELPCVDAGCITPLHVLARSQTANHTEIQSQQRLHIIILGAWPQSRRSALAVLAHVAEGPALGVERSLLQGGLRLLGFRA